MTTIPLRHVADVRVSNVDKKSVEGERTVRLCNYTDVYYQDVIDPQTDFMEATATPEQVRAFGLQAGDTLLTKDSETADDIAVPALLAEDLPGVVSGYHLALVRPMPGAIDPRFLFRALQSDFMREQFSVLASGVTRYGLTYGALRGAHVPLAVEDVEEQRRIADFLDDQVGRLDQVMSATEDQLAKAKEAEQAWVDESLEVLADAHGKVQLRRWIADVEQGWSPSTSDGPAGRAMQGCSSWAPYATAGSNRERTRPSPWM